MNLGFASPVSLQQLRHLVEDGDQLPPGYQFAPAADWVQELMDRGHNVVLYSTSREIAEPKTFRGDGLTIRIASQRQRGSGRDFFAQERNQLTQLMAADECDIIHAHWTYQFALAALATGIPTLITIHDLPWRVLGQFRDFHRLARLVMAYMVAQRGSHFTAVSQDAASHFRRYLARNAEITVIPNGLPNWLFEIGKGASRSTRPVPVFATILQGWSRAKNAKTAIRAFQILRRQVPNATLQMYGNGYEAGGSAYQWATLHNLEEGLEFKGPLSYSKLLKSVSENVDVVVHPSLGEAFSMTGLEALALRKVFIAGDSTPGMGEMLDSGANGVLVDVLDAEAIASAMFRLAQDELYRNRLANFGYERAFSRYRLERVFSQYEFLYSRILNSHAASIGPLRSEA